MVVEGFGVLGVYIWAIPKTMGFFGLQIIVRHLTFRGTKMGS